MWPWPLLGVVHRAPGGEDLQTRPLASGINGVELLALQGGCKGRWPVWYISLEETTLSLNFVV
jgi:hypothetical protein